MPSTSRPLWQYGLAILIIYFIAFITTSQNIQLIKTYLHRALWCCVVETAVWCPIKVVTYLTRSQLRIQPRLLQKLDPFITLLWCEMTVHIVAQSVQPFIVHASLSPALAEASTATDAPEPDPWGTQVRCLEIFCVSLAISVVSLWVRRSHGRLELHAYRLLLNADPGEAHITRLHVLAAAHGCLDHLLVTTALYLERIAAGSFVTSLVIAHEHLDGWEYWMFTAAAGLLMLEAIAYMFFGNMEAIVWEVEQRELMPGRRGGRQAGRQTIPQEMINRLCLRCVWPLEAWLRRVLPWRLPGLGRWWWFPELAALWPEAELRRFYVESLSESPPLALVAPWGRDATREQHVDLWRRAGLTRDLVLRDYSAIPTRVPI